MKQLKFSVLGTFPGSSQLVAPAESAMPWDLVIYKGTLLAVVDLQYTLSYMTGFGKADHNVTINILRNTDLKY